MWSRGGIKDFAKKDLKGNYWMAFLVSLIIVITGGSHNQLEFGSSASETGGAGTTNAITGETNYAIIFIFVFLFIIALRMFIGYMLEVGGRRFFMKLAKGESDFSHITYAFNSNYYFKIFITMFLRSIYVILWTLLFIIPGIIKLYAYRMVPYILAENPEIDPRKVLKLSKKMTKGEKWNIFVLDLSFLGWFILGALFFGVGVFFVQPYYDATNAELYLKLKEEIN